MKTFTSGLIPDFSFSLLIFFLLGPKLSSATNLVPNNGFESYSQLPTYYGQLNYCVGWSNVNGIYTFTWPWASPDYLHNNGGVGVQLPNTAFGTVHPYAGVAVAHFIPYYSPFSDDFREYIAIQLTQPMIPGVTYQVSFYAQSGENHDYIQGSNHLGVCFSNGSLTQIDHEPINVTPQLEYPGIFYDTAWQYVSFTYVASSDYDWMTIGNFYNDANTLTQTFYPTGLLGVHVFIDEVVVQPLTVPLTVSGDSIICQGETATFTASGAGNYWWEDLSNPGVSIDNDSILSVTPLITSDYVVHDAVSTDTITITVVDPPMVELGNDTTICNGQSVTLDADNPGATFLWSNGNTNQTLSVSTEGLVWVKVNNGLCSASDSILITVLSPPDINLGADITGCTGESFILHGGNASSYLWSTGSTDSSITVNATGTYWLTASNGLCTASDTVIVTIAPPPVANLGADTSLCTGQILILSGGSAASYLWSNGSNNSFLSIQLSGSYWVMLSNGNCLSSDTINITFNPLPAINLGPDVTACKGQSVFFDAGNAVSYLWSTGSTAATIEANQAGNYSVSISDGQCFNADTVMLSIIDSPSVNLGNDIVLCKGNPVSLHSNIQGVTYLWSTGETTSSIEVNSSGEYFLTVSNGYCSGIDSILVSVNDLPIVNLGNDTSFCSGAMMLDAGNTGASFEWSTGETSQQIVVDQTPAEISVVVTSNNCKSSDTIFLGNNCGVVIPNAFTPNGDGMNDLFLPVSANVNDFEMQIFNRFGEMIFFTTDPDQGWDGRYKGKEEEIGTYVYVIKSQSLSGAEEVYKGNLTLLR